MAKQRFRDTKKNRITPQKEKPNKVKKPAIPFAGKAIKAKAFLTDIFMLFMPLFYFVIYVVFGSLQNAGEHKLLAWSYTLIPFVIIMTIFMYKDEGRTPFPLWSECESLFPSITLSAAISKLSRNAVLEKVVVASLTAWA